MNKLKTTISLILLLFLSITLVAQSDDTFINDSTFIAEPLSPEAFEVMRLFFTYDKEFPLEVAIIETTNNEEYSVEKIEFNSVHENRVPGILAVPKTDNAPFPCVLLLHGAGAGGAKENWFDESDNYFGVAQGLLVSGYAVMMLDAKFFGERKSENEYENPLYFIREKQWRNIERDMLVQTTIDYRRAIDYLETRNDINASKIGVIGSSMGAMTTFLLTGVEPRVKVAVAKAAPNIQRKYSANSPYNFATAIKTQPFLMLAGKSDPFSGFYGSQQMFDLVTSTTKELIFYDSGHQLPEEWKEESIKWIQKYLK